MIIALWMEDLVQEAPEHHNKVGAVLVLPNDVILATDCSRDGVHAVARLLIKHSDEAKGCKIFVSRKPCPFCAKLLVQSKVKRVLFLPTREPEYYSNRRGKVRKCNEEQMRQVDTLFTASTIAQTKFVLQVEDKVIDEAEESMKENGGNAETWIEDLIDKYSDSKWMKRIQKDLPWPELDKKMIKQIQEYFKKVMKWIAVVLVQSGKRELELYNAKTDDGDQFNHTQHHQRFMEIARFLAQRTDDPETGVGAVIVSPKMEVISFGWNGFPFGAQYGEFARASDKDNTKLPRKIDEKYPYSIHAEQNALLMRNTRSLKDATLYVTKSPCDECAPLIAMEGIKTVFVDGKVECRKPPKRHELGHKLGYNWFVDKVNDGTFTCYKNLQKPNENVTPPPRKKRRRVR